MEILRLLSASVRLGTFFGVEVRVYWLTLLLPLMAVGEMRGAGFGAGEALAFGILGSVLLMGVVYTHEMGHVVAARRYRVHTPLITLSPLGGLAHLGAALPHPRADIFVSAAGPAVHLLWLAVFWPLSLLLPAATWRPSGWWLDPIAGHVDYLVDLNLGLLLFNLLPFFPMDGGRVLRALLALRLHPNRATRIAAFVGLAGASAFVVMGFLVAGYRGSILLVIGLSNVLACVAELRAARHHAGPYMVESLAPWQADPEAWRGGTARGGSEARQEGEGRRARRRRERAQREAERRRREDVALDAELDRVLARVSEVGMSGLTASERSLLERASERRRSGR